MKEFITIKNFGPLSNIENIEIKQFTLLIGESASGKSTLMKVVCMMRYLTKTRLPMLKAVLKIYGFDQILTGKSVIKYHVSTDQDEYVDCLIRCKKLIRTGQVNEKFDKLSYITEDRNIEDVKLASTNNKKIPLEYIGMQLKVIRSTRKSVRYLIIPDDNSYHAISLSKASAGIRSSAPLALVTDYFANEFEGKRIGMHIESPEQNLSPTAQVLLIEKLIYTAQHAKTGKTVNMMMTTHSPYILNYMNVCLSQTSEGHAICDKENMSVYRLYDGRTSSLLMQDDNGKLCVDTYDMT